eukprot:CFRG1783T1
MPQPILFRSEDMSLAQMIVQSDACYDSVGELGEFGFFMFKDLNPDVNSFSRSFVKEIRRADEMERKLRFCAAQMEKGGIVADASNLLSYQCEKKHSQPSYSEIDELDHKLTRLETEVKEMNDNEGNLQRNYLELIELRHIVKLTAQYFDEARRKSNVGSLSAESSDSTPLLGGRDTDEGDIGATHRGVKLGYVTGVIHRDRYAAFERVMWRGTRGNVYMRHVDIEEQLMDPATGEMISKVVFVAFYQGDVLETKVKRICDGFGATNYPCPEGYEERRALETRVASGIEELQMVLGRTADFRKRILSDIADSYEEWYVKTLKMKATYHTMNKFNFDVSQSALIAEGWIPTAKLAHVQSALKDVTDRLGSGVPTIVKTSHTTEMPPTYHITNKFTHAFQAIVDAYGVASYQEVNPGLFTLISFPFLFAVMFGDVGHGVIMTLMAAAMIYAEKTLIRTKDMGEMVETVFAGRYMILLMGMFSIYTGFIYNDCFAKNLWLFDSSFKLPTVNWGDGAMFLNVRDVVYNDVCPDGCGYVGHPYPIGVDPVWSLASNKLAFLNSLKMKMSVLIGVNHMSFGVVLTVFNAFYFKRAYAVWAEFVPQFFFLFGVFGYLCAMIVAKWCMTFESVSPEGSTALIPSDPSLLITLVNMFLKPGVNTYETKTVLYEGQSTVQLFIVGFALICIPWMFLVSPLWQNHLDKQQKASGYKALGQSDNDHDDQDDEDDEGGHVVQAGGGHGHGEFELGEVLIHNSIHSIEFCLGAVSNTASYLRLWALSLAHAQLSEVLWDMILKPTFSMNPVALVLGFGVWGVLTVGVLLMMEGMSAFLHALRLHWVEFQQKFYGGEGYSFVPFSFENYMTGVF